MQPVAFSFSDMRGQANDYLGTVRTEAAKIVQQAHQQAEQIRRQAEVAGRKAAEAAIERMLDERVGKRMETLLPALETLLAEMNNTKAQLLNRWEQSALKVATAIAERIIRREVAQDPQITLDLIRRHAAAGRRNDRDHAACQPDGLRKPGIASHSIGGDCWPSCAERNRCRCERFAGRMLCENEVRRDRSADRIAAEAD